MKLYNTLSRKIEEFRPLKKGEASMYNCGPTVYDYAHIGNFRAFIFADLLRRFLEFKGLKVKQVMNLTDVGHMFLDQDVGEDKIEEQAKKEGKNPWEVADYYAKAFLEDHERLGLEKPMAFPRATEYVKEMIALVERLLEKGYAYEANGSVYYDISKFKGYGKLSKFNIEELRAGAGGRVEKNPDKKGPLDFAVWIHDSKHVMQWDSPWGKGYPGWHIECSAMAMALLGETIDIHTGGEDNMFPHHECEIAQSEGANGKEFAKFWLHVKHLMVEGEKMSKSKGNFYTVRDILEKGYSPRALRYVLMGTHYRQNLNFTFKGLDDAEKVLERIDNFRELLGFSLEKAGEEFVGEKEKKVLAELEGFLQDFEGALEEDLGISEALAAFHSFMALGNSYLSSGGKNKKVLEAFMQALKGFDSVLGIVEWGKSSGKKLSGEQEKLLAEREKARKEKDWAKADELRDKLKEQGIIVDDTSQGTKVKFA